MVRFFLICAVIGVVGGVASAYLIGTGVKPVVPSAAVEVRMPYSPRVLITSPAAARKEEQKPQVESVTNYRVPILTYHYIGGNPNPKDRRRDALSVSPDIFEQQVAYLVKEGYTTISLDTLAAAMEGKASLPSNPIVLTFDDGYIDFYLNAYPILKKYHLNATVFIPTGLVGQPSYMTWDQIVQIHRDGWIQFEAHGVTHRDLTIVPAEEREFELVQSKKDLEQRLGTIVNWVAYPYGKFNALVLKEAQRAGYVGALTTMSGVYHSTDNLYVLKRRNVSGMNTVELFAGVLQ